MPTSFTPRSNVTSSYSPRPAIQSDDGAGLDWNDDILTDENDSIVIFDTGVFYDSNTTFTPRTPI